MTNSPATPPAASSEPDKRPLVLTLLGFLLAGVLVLALPLAVLGFDVWRVVFNPPLVKAVLTDEAVRSDLIPAGLEWFSESRARQRVETGEVLSGVDEPDIVLLLSYLDVEGWRAIKREILTDEFLVHLVSVTVDGTYGWIDSADRVPQITWDMRPFKAGVVGQAGENAIAVAYGALAPCTEAEIADFLARLSAAPAGVEVLYNLCAFPDPWHADQFEDYLHALVDVNQNIPDQLALTAALSQTADRGGVGPEALKSQLRLIRQLGLWGWVLPVAALLFITLACVRSVRSLSRWVGLPLLLGGLLTVILALLLRSTVASVLSSGILSETPPLLQQEVSRVITRLAGEIFNPMLIQAIVIALIGVGLVVWHQVQGRRPMAPAASSAPA